MSIDAGWFQKEYLFALSVLYFDRESVIIMLRCIGTNFT